jgi:hypothetical protein
MKQFVEPAIFFAGFYHNDEVGWIHPNIRRNRDSICQNSVKDGCYLPPTHPGR